VDPQQAVREKLGHIGGAAQEHGKDAADKARRGVNALAARMGKVALISTVILWIAWFFMPGLSFSVSFFGAGQSKSFTLWDALALDPGNNMNPGSHGFLSLVVIAGIVAPIAASFIRRPYARYLYAAPLACLLVAWFTIQHEIDQVLAASGLAADLAAFKMSPDYGAFIIALASLVVAARVLKLQATDNAGSPASTPTGRVPFLVDRFCTECGKELSPGENLCAECRDGRQRSAAAV
jgi:hypothetical protein